MTFKFCFENEIRRCSEPPKDFSSLASFLTNMFTARLPSEYNLSYTSPQDETIYLNNEETYQKLLNSKSSKAIKIYITPKQLPVAQQVKPESIKQAIPDKILSETKIVTHFQQEQKEDSVKKLEEVAPVSQQVKTVQERDVKKIIKQTIKEDMPFIIAQVKEALIKEGLLKDIFKQSSEKQGYQVREHQWPVHPNPYYQKPYDVVESVPVNKPVQVEKKSSLIEKMMGAVAELPGKATEMIESLVDKFDKEVYLECPEGRYAKSVVETANQLQEIFPDEIRKELLDFVKGLPKDMPLDEVADLFAHRQTVRA